MGRIGAAGLRAVLLWSSETLNVQPRQAPFAHHRGQVGGGIPDSKTAPEGAAVYCIRRASLLRLYEAS